MNYFVIHATLFRTNIIMNRKNAFFSRSINALREKLRDTETSKIAKIYLRKLLAWFQLDYWQHNLDLTEQFRKK